MKKLDLFGGDVAIGGQQSNNALLRLVNVSKSFTTTGSPTPVLRQVNFVVSQGDFLVIFGPSGCGKSTVLHTLLGLEPPDSGRVDFFGHNLYSNTTDDDRALYRKKYIGMVYQQPNWIRSLTVLENVAFPLQLLGQSKGAAVHQAQKILHTVEMAAYANYIPTELSSGQQQRVALARALVSDPAIIVADEPTGNLDYESGQVLMKLLSTLHHQAGKTIVMVTHDLEYLRFAQIALEMLDGQIVASYQGKKLEAVLSEVRGKRGVLHAQTTVQQS